MKLYTEEHMKSFYELGKIDGIIGIKKEYDQNYFLKLCQLISENNKYLS